MYIFLSRLEFLHESKNITCSTNGTWHFTELLLVDLEECLILVIFHCKVNSTVLLTNYYFIVWTLLLFYNYNIILYLSVCSGQRRRGSSNKENEVPQLCVSPTILCAYEAQAKRQE